ncbi:MAG TPA: HAMP domain-containing sensor histidine kinase [Rubrobacteraceae bacterium]|nr:HAMP domain-containing sensor histidine kinase [Rubrobacteraceae bacterium]
MTSSVRTVGVGLLFLAGALGITIAFAALVFGVPTGDIPKLALVLASVGGGLGLLALLLMWPTVLRKISGLRGQLVGIGLIGSLLLVGMVLAGAWSMFISEHDLSVLSTMILFATLLSVGFSLYAAAPIAWRIWRLRAGTEKLTSGEFETEFPVDGRDEIARLAEDLNRMAAALKRAEEREHEMDQARRDLITAVSHDLRTPLAAVLALVEAVADGVVPDRETEARYLSSARREILNLGALVDDLFDLVQIDAGVLRLNLEPGSLYDLASDTLASFQPQAKRKGVRLVGEVPLDIDPLLANLPKLQRVLQNLIGNALRHTPAGGTIYLRAEPRGELVQVEVVDTGEGIPPQELPYVFERSFRGEKAHTHPSETEISSGAGLGLAISRALVEAHGGTIEVESEPGNGTRLCFTLRRA